MMSGFNYRRFLPRLINHPDYLIIIPIIVLAGYVAFIPHQLDSLPVHIDEWMHMAFSNAMMDQGKIDFVDPFLGKTVMGININLETGFHIIFGVFQRISGLSWFIIFRYFPSLVLILTALSVFILVRREGFGWESAFFVCLIPTTVGILGPGFLVPVALALPFFALTGFLAFNYRRPWHYLVIFLMMAFLLVLHAPSAICLIIILFPYVLLNIKGNFRHSLGLGLALIMPFFVTFPWIFKLLLPTFKELLVPQAMPPYVDWPQVVVTYGYLPISICLLGCFVLAMKGGKKNYGLVLGLLAILLMLLAFYTFHYGLGIVYARGLIPMMLILSIVAGAGLHAVRQLRLPDAINRYLKLAFLRQNIGNVICLVLIGLTLAFAIPTRQHTPYYHMIDNEDYAAFSWISENIGTEHDRAILDPWKATAFTAITGKKVYSRIHVAPLETDYKAYAFFDISCDNSTFLRENGISIVYSRLPCNNPDLIEVRKNVYLMKGAR